jgi:hypothetical protein
MLMTRRKSAAKVGGGIVSESLRENCYRLRGKSTHGPLSGATAFVVTAVELGFIRADAMAVAGKLPGMDRIGGKLLQRCVDHYLGSPDSASVE